MTWEKAFWNDYLISLALPWTKSDWLMQLRSKRTERERERERFAMTEVLVREKERQRERERFAMTEDLVREKERQR